MKNCTVNILGTEYSISVDESLEKTSCDGFAKNMIRL